MTREIKLELEDEQIDRLSADEYSVQERAHRAIRLYVGMDNADEVLAEAEMLGGGAD